MVKQPRTQVAYRLPALTIEKIKALRLDLDIDSTEVIIRAVDELWRRECGDGDPRTSLDELAETMDDLRTRIEAIEARRLSAAEEE